MLKLSLVFCLFVIICNVSYGDITSGRYGVNQVFDAQRNPAYPTAGALFTLSSFATPLDENGNQYTMASGEYIYFFYVGGTTLDNNGNAACNVGIKWRKSGGGDQVIASSGVVYGLTETGFLYEAAGFGTFVNNNKGYALGGGTSYTPSAASASCAELNAYSASSTPLNIGETAALNNVETELNVVATAIARQQIKAPLFYQETINKQIFNRLNDLRFSRLQNAKSTKSTSNTTLKLDTTSKYRPVEEIIEKKVNGYYTDLVKVASSSITEVLHQKAQFWTDGALTLSSNDGSEKTKIKVNSQGLSFGIDYIFSENLILGSSIGVGIGNVEIGSRSEIDDTFYALAFYNSFYLGEKISLDSTLAINYLTSDSSRFDEGTSSINRGTRDGIGYNVSTQLNYDNQFQTNDQRLWYLNTNGKINYISTHLDAFTESGSNNYSYSKQSLGKLSFEIGTKLQTAFMIGQATLSPNLSLGYKRDLTDTSSGTISSVATPSLGSSKITFVDEDKNSFEVGTGAHYLWNLAHSISSNYYYSQGFKNESRSHLINVKYAYAF